MVSASGESYYAVNTFCILYRNLFELIRLKILFSYLWRPPTDWYRREARSPCPSPMLNLLSKAITPQRTNLPITPLAKVFKCTISTDMNFTSSRDDLTWGRRNFSFGLSSQPCSIRLHQPMYIVLFLQVNIRIKMYVPVDYFS